MTSRLLPLMLFPLAFVAFAQSAATPDPVLDTSGLPSYVKLLPKPAAEPWHKITEKERFDFWAYNSLGPTAILGSAIGAGFSQWMNSPEEWGQGWGPYGKRVGDSFAGTFIGNTVIYGTSYVFGDDNRYYRSSRSDFGHRLGYVLVSPILAHNNQGGLRFSTSSFLGGVASSSIPLAWAPPSWQGWGSVFTNAAIWYGQRAGVNLARELYPSIARYFKNKNASKLKTAASPAKP